MKLNKKNLTELVESALKKRLAEQYEPETFGFDDTPEPDDIAVRGQNPDMSGLDDANRMKGMLMKNYRMMRIPAYDDNIEYSDASFLKILRDERLNAGYRRKAKEVFNKTFPTLRDDTPEAIEAMDFLFRKKMEELAKKVGTADSFLKPEPLKDPDSFVRPTTRIVDEPFGLRADPTLQENKMKLTKERLLQIIKEEVQAADEARRPGRPGLEPKYSPRQKRIDRMKAARRPPMEPGPEMSPEEKTRADAEDTIEKMRMIKRMGLQTMTRIPNDEVKAMVMELAPDLKDSIL